MVFKREASTKNQPYQPVPTLQIASPSLSKLWCRSWPYTTSNQSDEVERNFEFNKITETLAANGYPRKLVNKEISRQLKRSETCTIQDAERELVTVSIPFIDGLSKEISSIAKTAG